jgi:hypothetical protein
MTVRPLYLLASFVLLALSGIYLVIARMPLAMSNPLDRNLDYATALLEGVTAILFFILAFKRK